MRISQLVTLIFMTNITFAQEALFKDYDFDNGGYYLLGTRSESDKNELADSLGEWYTNDISVLNLFKSEWIFTELGKDYSCGYHYIVHLCKDGLELENFSINLNCNEIVSDKGKFYFDTFKLSKFKNNLSKPKIESKSFKNINSARKYQTNILQDSNLIFTPSPNWTRFEGTFNFSFECNNENNDCLSNKVKVLEKLKTEINTKYPKEDFELEENGGSNSELFVKVKCNKTLEEKFNIYKRNPQNDNWVPYELLLMSYWLENK